MSNQLLTHDIYKQKLDKYVKMNNDLLKTLQFYESNKLLTNVEKFDRLMKNTMSYAIQIDNDGRKQDIKHANELALLLKKPEVNKHIPLIINYLKQELKKH